MNKEIFWKIMLDTNRESGGEPSVQQELIEEELNQLSPKEIIDFDNIFTELFFEAYDWKLWAAAYIMNGGCSTDCFIDFRGWLIAQGEKVYLKALSDPDSLVELDKIDEDIEWEGYDYLANTVYEEKTGEEIPITSGSNHPSEPKGDKWDESEVDTLLPKLSKKYSGE